MKKFLSILVVYFLAFLISHEMQYPFIMALIVTSVISFYFVSVEKKS